MVKLRTTTFMYINFYQLLVNGMHIGHHVNSANLLLDRFFVGRRFSIIILNLLVSVLNLRRAFFVLYGSARERGAILFVMPVWYNTNIFFYLRRKIYSISEPLWANLWIAGFLTNHKRLLWAYWAFLKSDRLTRNQKKVLSILSLDVLLLSLPGVVVSLNRMLGNLAVIEASALRIPVVGLLDSNVFGGFLMYPVPSNDDSYKVLFFYVLFFSKIILVAKMTRLTGFSNIYRTRLNIGLNKHLFKSFNKYRLLKNRL